MITPIDLKPGYWRLRRRWIELCEAYIGGMIDEQAFRDMAVAEGFIAGDVEHYLWQVEHGVRAVS